MSFYVAKVEKDGMLNECISHIWSIFRRWKDVR